MGRSRTRWTGSRGAPCSRPGTERCVAGPCGRANLTQHEGACCPPFLHERARHTRECTGKEGAGIRGGGGRRAPLRALHSPRDDSRELAGTHTSCQRDRLHQNQHGFLQLETSIGTVGISLLDECMGRFPPARGPCRPGHGDRSGSPLPPAPRRPGRSIELPSSRSLNRLPVVLDRDGGYYLSGVPRGRRQNTRGVHHVTMPQATAQDPRLTFVSPEPHTS